MTHSLSYIQPLIHLRNPYIDLDSLSWARDMWKLRAGFFRLALKNMAPYLYLQAQELRRKDEVRNIIDVRGSTPWLPCSFANVLPA
jgi:hypothetical protein